jgi:oligopeptide transport system permease protein
MSDPLSTQTAPIAVEPVATSAAETTAEKPRGLAADAWRDLRKRPVFLISLAFIVAFLVLAIFPGLFTNYSPGWTDLAQSRQGPKSGHPFGFDVQGGDVYARTIYGARASIIVGTAAVLGNLIFGGLVGIIAGYVGGWADGLLSRVGDIFLGLPFVLGAIVLLSTFAGATSDPSAPKIITLVVLALVALGWPSFARIMRSSVIAAKSQDYVIAARALGAGPLRIIFRHVLPNAVGPLLVVSTISLGVYIGAEATLSFLGVGLRPPVVSWGVMISDGRSMLRSGDPHALLFPAGFLVLAVLSFVMLGDAVRDAFDPKLR